MDTSQKRKQQDVDPDLDPLDALRVPDDPDAEEIDEAAILNDLLRDLSPDLLAESTRAAKTKVRGKDESLRETPSITEPAEEAVQTDETQPDEPQPTAAADTAAAEPVAESAIPEPELSEKSDALSDEIDFFDSLIEEQNRAEQQADTPAEPSVPTEPSAPATPSVSEEITAPEEPVAETITPAPEAVSQPDETEPMEEEGALDALLNLGSDVDESASEQIPPEQTLPEPAATTEEAEAVDDAFNELFRTALAETESESVPEDVPPEPVAEEEPSIHAEPAQPEVAPETLEAVKPESIEPEPRHEEPAPRKSEAVGTLLTDLFGVKPPEPEPEPPKPVPVTATTRTLDALFAPTPQAEEPVAEEQPPAPEPEELDTELTALEPEPVAEAPVTPEPVQPEPVAEEQPPAPEPEVRTERPARGGTFDEDALDASLSAALGLGAAEEEPPEEPAEIAPTEAVVAAVPPVEPAAPPVEPAMPPEPVAVESEKPAEPEPQETGNAALVAAITSAMADRYVTALERIMAGATHPVAAEPEGLVEDEIVVADRPQPEPAPLSPPPAEPASSSTPPVEEEVEDEFVVVDTRPAPAEEPAPSAAPSPRPEPAPSEPVSEEIPGIVMPQTPAEEQPQPEEESSDLDIAQMLVEEEEPVEQPAPPQTDEAAAPPVEPEPETQIVEEQAPPQEKAQEEEEEDPLIAEIRGQKRKLLIITITSAVIVLGAMIYFAFFVLEPKSDAPPQPTPTEQTDQTGQALQQSAGNNPAADVAGTPASQQSEPAESPPPPKPAPASTSSGEQPPATQSETPPAAPQRTPARQQRSTTAVPPGLTATSGAWTVHIESHESQRHAETGRQKWERRGYSVMMWAATVRGTQWYRIGVGHYGSRSEATQAKQYLSTTYPSEIDWSPVTRIPQGAW